MTKEMELKILDSAIASLFTTCYIMKLFTETDSIKDFEDEDLSKIFEELYNIRGIISIKIDDLMEELHCGL